MSKNNGKIPKDLLIKINHYCVGIVIILKGIDKAEHFDHFPLSVICFFLAGAVIIIGATFHHQIAKVFKKFDASFFLLEGVALLLAAIILLEKSGSKIPYFLLFASTLYFILGFALLFTNGTNREMVFGKIQKMLRILFIAAAVITLAVNIIFFNSFWMYVMSALYLVAGALMEFTKKMMQKSEAYYD